MNEMFMKLLELANKRGKITRADFNKIFTKIDFVTDDGENYEIWVSKKEKNDGK